MVLSLIEIEIGQSRSDRAETLLLELLDVYNRLTEPDIIDRFGHVRALIAWARISPLREAGGRLECCVTVKQNL